MGSAGGHHHRRWRISAKKPEIDHVRNDINVTPLVDVMLVLLIIFMLMTLVMGRGKEVDLPTATQFSQEKDKQQPVVTVDNEGSLYLEKVRLGTVGPAALKTMGDQIQKHWKSPVTVKAGGAGRVYLKASSEVSYARLYPVLEYLNKTMDVPTVDIAVAEGKDL